MEIMGCKDCFLGERMGLTVKKLMIRFGIILFLGFAIFATLALAPVKDGDPGEDRQICRDVVRFHVVAKSDQSADQELKLKVRDAVLDYLRPNLEGVQDQQEAAVIIQDKLPQIEEVAVQTLRINGCSDQVQVYYGDYDFPVRVYGPLTFPEGRYQSLRIVLGEGEGKNWWCCLFPPLCFVDITNSAQQLQEDKKPDSDVCQLADDGDEGDETNSDSSQLADEDDKDLCRHMDQEKPGDEQDKQDKQGQQVEKILLIDSGSEPEEQVRLTTKIGEWLENSRDRSLLSWLWQWRS